MLTKVKILKNQSNFIFTIYSFAYSDFLRQYTLLPHILIYFYHDHQLSLKNKFEILGGKKGKNFH